MLRFIAIVCAGALGTSVFASNAEAQWGHGYASRGHGHSQHAYTAPAYGYGGYGYSPQIRSYSNYNYGTGYGYGGYHNTSHYDYRSPSVYRHGGHLHFQPGHYDIHRSGHGHQ